MKANHLFLIGCLLLIGGILGWRWLHPEPARKSAFERSGVVPPQGRRVVKTDAEWEELLTAPQFYVTREKGTEGRNSSPLTHLHQAGVYECVCCHNPLFASRTKFDSRTGWPSFYVPIAPNAVYTDFDGRRTEVLCSVCDAHLGHVFTDGPEPTGLRYCMNGTALTFKPAR
ncbi:peptide-methionine (R)-S-oxide reductase MsrB [Arsenicibacter rosenii]|uniref:peptide-methionine (R)-S-oxide reductase n=1 Tax=Arsenicibacter rosenii TaxID=1750698 RepID=A0A1S2VI41_9BACT|nr:peptide-methionine (R)-S-oxide reductase MsrB [Arsenicibacter rosenii]OIN58412.1 peptide-methionine (R)-S-oxide reductase [Arsenicibacter rosenii]